MFRVQRWICHFLHNSRTAFTLLLLLKLHTIHNFFLINIFITSSWLLITIRENLSIPPPWGWLTNPKIDVRIFWPRIQLEFFWIQEENWMEMIMSTHLGLWVCREMSHASFDNQNRPPERERFYPNIILLCTLGQKLKSLLDNAPNCLLSWVCYPKYKLFFSLSN